MTTTRIHLLIGALVVTASAIVARPARGTPDVSAPRAGFSRKMAADAMPATLGKAREAKTIFASVQVTAELGADSE